MILVTSATSTNGSELLRQLALTGQPVRAMARHPAKAQHLKSPSIELVQGDFTDVPSLDAAMHGVEKVFLLTPSEPRQVELEANVIDAAQRAGVKYIVKFSVIHASFDSPSKLLRWHRKGEDRIEKSGMAYTFLHPNMFMQELLRQVETMRTQGAFYLPLAELPISLVDVRDNAAVAARVLTESGHEGRKYEITGPAAPTMNEVADILSGVAGHQIKYVPITIEQFKAASTAAGLPAWLVDDIAELYGTFEHNGVVRATVEAVTGKPARSLEQFAKDHAGAFRPA